MKPNTGSTQRELTRQQFFTSYKKFTDTFAKIDGTPEMKDTLEREVKTYADTFAKWIEAYDRVHPLRALIDIDSQNMLPRADKIIDAGDAKPRTTHRRPRPRRKATRAPESSSVGIAMVALGLGFSAG